MHEGANKQPKKKKKGNDVTVHNYRFRTLFVKNSSNINLYLTHESRVTLGEFSLFLTFSKLNMEHRVELEISAVVAKFGHFRLIFQCRGREEIYKDVERTRKAIVQLLIKPFV